VQRQRRFYDNDFQFVRDNPGAEDQDQLVDLSQPHLQRARLVLARRVSEAPFTYSEMWDGSTTSRRGNVPAVWAADGRCNRTALPADAENECSRSRTGKVIAVRARSKPRNGLSNNSWYVRSVVDGGIRNSGWNNATLFCDPNVIVQGMCVAEYDGKALRAGAPGVTEGVPNRFPWAHRVVRRLHRRSAHGSHGISNHPDYPDKLAALGYPVSGFGDPGSSTAQWATSGCVPMALREGRVAR
jgi:hypothetical protein